ncbi:uncharacterized protein AMSG_02497 [Thecamonas trahens ATCC 50062]|uniref:AB hydrolase-1 domain-containing protein n=1 Tax=Thecamonas trahens ATCC 50062 TaxID=461836 RepID=A0A0L0D5I9_THETB|nr:hypothetical protein AMSG_02497 [Thecamonas trahens ATCC 50062]KNC47480.1 hypothetical protein AMSG_02497 [Thecamonas trahens ATCC 50062]|eukprot:XP_013759416.1 hypothetical protein AMSG_02497 [Thecamonas trahens ATCC 50062]
MFRFTRMVMSVSSGVETVAELDGVVVAIHGFPGNSQDYRYMGPLLTEKNMAMIRLIVPGFNGTPRLSPPPASSGLNINDVVAQRLLDNVAGLPASSLGSASPQGARLLDEMASHDVPLMLVGHSFGSVLATAALNLVTPPAGLRVGGVLLAPVGYRKHRGLRASPEAVFWLGRHLPFVLDYWPFRDQIWKGFKAFGFHRTTAYECVTAMKYVAHLDFDRHKALGAAVPCPLAVCYATDDKLIEPEIFHDIVANLEPEVVRELDSGGHNIQKDRVHDVVDALVELQAKLPAFPASGSRN